MHSSSMNQSTFLLVYLVGTIYSIITCAHIPNILSIYITDCFQKALEAKLSSLTGEFEAIRSHGHEWFKDNTLSQVDWFSIDAWYRSRCLELPSNGACMVPCLDLANHSGNANAYYEQNADGDVTLLLRPDQELATHDEICISYGENKSAAEMLFSYGFIDQTSQETNSLVLDMQPMEDDPLGKAKIAAFFGPPTLLIRRQGNKVHWEGTCVYLLCLNEEDGLEFKLLQQTDGSSYDLEVFWQESNVTNIAGHFEDLIRQHELGDVFTLRAIALVQDRIRQQLERLYASEDFVQDLSDSPQVDKARGSLAIELRSLETQLLEQAYNAMDDEKNELLKSPVVQQYLGSMDHPAEEPSGEDGANEEEDFS
jgi:hypothetical protein